MADTTPNYGFPIPEADGTDYIVPADIRTPVTQIDTELKNQDTRLDALELIRSRGALVSLTAAASGECPPIAHGLGVVPTNIQLTHVADAVPITLTVKLASATATHFTVKCFRDTGAVYVGSITFYWLAY